MLLYLKNDMRNSTDTISFPLVLTMNETSFKEYLKIAFSKDKIKDRGDYLLVELYKMFYWSFEAKSFHKFSAM